MTYNPAWDSIAISRQVSIDFGVSPTSFKTFSIVDTSVAASSKISVNQAGESDLDQLSFSATAGSGSFSLDAVSSSGPVVGSYTINYTVS